MCMRICYQGEYIARSWVVRGRTGLCALCKRHTRFFESSAVRALTLRSCPWREKLWPVVCRLYRDDGGVLAY